MIQLPLYDKTGVKTGSVEVDENMFGGKIRKALLHDVIVMYEAARRQGNASTKTRGEVAGSKRKPWKQKHTGRARAGTARSPIWRHGGISFGPKPRDFSFDMPKRMKRIALDCALLGKFKDQETLVIDSLAAAPKPSTKAVVQVLARLGIERSCLIGIKDHSKELHLSTRNIPRVSLSRVGDFNAYEVLKHKHLVLTKEALDALVAARKG